MARTPLSAIAQYAPCNILIRGSVMFSRVASKIEGRELEAQNQVARTKGRPEHMKPYITITIKNPVIVDNGSLPPQVKSVITERFYTRPDGTVTYTQESKSPFLPEIAYSADAGELRGQGIADRNVPLQAEFAQGMDVTLGVNLFKSGMNPGLGLNFILVNEPIRYYTSSALASALSSQGITYTPPTASETMVQESYTEPAVPYESQEFTNNVNQFEQFGAPVSYANTPAGDLDIPFRNVSAPNPYNASQQVQRPVRN